MNIGILQIDLFMSDSQSLKEKRMVLKSLKTRLRNNFNVAVSELDYHEKWQRTSIGVVSIGNERRALDSMLAKIVEFVERDRSVEIIDYSTEFL